MVFNSPSLRHFYSTNVRFQSGRSTAITVAFPQKESHRPMPITVHEGDTIIASTYVVEEHVFINCKLKNCKLYYSGGPFEWVNTSFENCQWGFRGPAKD